MERALCKIGVPVEKLYYDSQPIHTTRSPVATLPMTGCDAVNRVCSPSHTSPTIPLRTCRRRECW